MWYKYRLNLTHIFTVEEFNEIIIIIFRFENIWMELKPVSYVYFPKFRVFWLKFNGFVRGIPYIWQVENYLGNWGVPT